VTGAGLAVLGLGGLVVHTIDRSTSTDPIGRWNAIAIQAGATLERGTSEQRELAMMHIAIHDALGAIRPVYAPYAVKLHAHANASPEAAIAAAAHEVLVSTVPLQRDTLDAEYRQALDDIPDGTPKAEGLAVGRRAARAIIALRAGDGAENADIPYDGKPGLGAWEPTPPDHIPALLPGWANVAPFAIGRADRFLPPPPPDLQGSEYARQYAAVKAIGNANSQVRTPEQGEIARFWSANVGEGWNEIARMVVDARMHDRDRANDLDLWERARLFALLNVAMADGFVSGWDAKYHYRFWRPVTAIHRGDSDGNPATLPDPTWTPYLVTPQHPEYPSTHSVLSGAAVAVLHCALGTDRASFRLTSRGTYAGITRTFDGFDQAAREVAASRLYAGVHFPIANAAGLAEGRQIGELVCARTLGPLQAR
jgi:hypothetical protein